MAKSAELAHCRHTKETLRLGMGEVCTRKDIIASARMWFLVALESLCPELLDDLRREFADTTSHVGGLLEVSWELQERFRAWCMRHRLTKGREVAEWAAQAACETAGCFNFIPKWEGWSYPGVGGGCWVEPAERPRGWIPEFHRASRLKGAQRRAVELALRRGAGEAARPEWKQEREHFEWVVLHQIRGEGFDSIGARYGRSPEAVRVAVKKLNKLLGLGLPQGRPRRIR